jgi:hypothetical protein
MIWLLPNPLPPSPVSKLGRQLTGRLRKWDKLMAEGEEGEGKEANLAVSKLIFFTGEIFMQIQNM